MITAESMTSGGRYRFKEHDDHILHKIAMISKGTEVV